MRHVAAALFACTLFAACSKDGPSAGSASILASKSGKIDDSAAGSVSIGGTHYRPVTMTAMGAVSGTVKLQGMAPPPTVPVTIDQDVCGTTAESGVSNSPKGLSNAIVWITDVETGKPLPMDKRKELASDNCALDPRVQAAVVGTTFNVFNDDKLIHRLIFLRAGTHDTLTVMPFFNSGQVVASERLAKTPGIVEIRCVQHPWTRGYIAVFDHPYFAVTEKDGSFKIDSLPPGNYKMMVWHEGAAQPVEQQIHVTTNGMARADVAIAVR